MKTVNIQRPTLISQENIDKYISDCNMVDTIFTGRAIGEIVTMSAKYNIMIDTNKSDAQRGRASNALNKLTNNNRYKFSNNSEWILGTMVKIFANIKIDKTVILSSNLMAVIMSKLKNGLEVVA